VTKNNEYNCSQFDDLDSVLVTIKLVPHMIDHPKSSLAKALLHIILFLQPADIPVCNVVTLVPREIIH